MSRRARQLFGWIGVLLLSLTAHFTLQAPQAGAIPCQYVELSDPYVYVEVCPPI